MVFCYSFALVLFYSSINAQIDWSKTFTTNQSNPLYQDTCSKGYIQSPIEVNFSNSYYNYSINIVYENYSTVSTGFTMSDKYINVTQAANLNLGNILLERYGFLSMYKLIDVRIKVPSEHSINGVIGSMEIQLIHQKNLGQYFAQNQNVPLPDANSYLGISLIYSETNTNFGDNGFAKDLISAYNTGSKNIFLPAYQLTIGKNFYLYEGSETNYPCDENFNWIVMSEIYGIDQNSISVIKNKYSQLFIGGKNVKSSASLASRPIFRNFKLGQNDTRVYVYPINSAIGVYLNKIILLFSLIIIILF